jgi:mRNA degradation ribonuclease J1/J2
MSVESIVEFTKKNECWITDFNLIIKSCEIHQYQQNHSIPSVHLIFKGKNYSW